jgi:hypothetical protein
VSTCHWTILFNRWMTIQFPIDPPQPRKGSGRSSLKPFRSGSHARPEAAMIVLLDGYAAKGTKAR